MIKENVSIFMIRLQGYEFFSLFISQAPLHSWDRLSTCSMHLINLLLDVVPTVLVCLLPFIPSPTDFAFSLQSRLQNLAVLSWCWAFIAFTITVFPSAFCWFLHSLPPPTYSDSTLSKLYLSLPPLQLFPHLLPDYCRSSCNCFDVSAILTSAEDDADLSGMIFEPWYHADSSYFSSVPRIP